MEDFQLSNTNKGNVLKSLMITGKGVCLFTQGHHHKQTKNIAEAHSES